MFKVGDIVICRRPEGYRWVEGYYTKNAEYIVITESSGDSFKAQCDSGTILIIPNSAFDLAVFNKEYLIKILKIV